MHSVLLRLVGDMDAKIEQMAPEHYADMRTGTQPVEICIPEAFVTTFRDQLGPNNARHLVYLQDHDVYRLDVRFMAGLESPGSVTNLTVNLQRLLMKLIVDHNIDLKDVVVILKHLDGGDLKASDKLTHGGVSITSPFYTHDCLRGGEFAAYLDSLNIDSLTKTPIGHSSLGSLYALVHLVYAAFVADGVDISSMSAEELESLIRGSLIVQTRDNLVEMMEKLRNEPRPKIFDREAKRQAFLDSKAVLTNHFCNVYLSHFERFDTDSTIDECRFWRGHLSMLEQVAKLDINQASIDRRRRGWQKKADDLNKTVLSNEEVSGISRLALDRLLPPYLERFLVEMERGHAGDGESSPIVQRFDEMTKKRRVPSLGAFDGSTLALNEILQEPSPLNLCPPEQQLAVKLVMCCTIQMAVPEVAKAVESSDAFAFSQPLRLQVFLRSVLASSILPQSIRELAAFASQVLVRDVAVTPEASAVRLAQKVATASQLKRAVNALLSDRDERTMIEQELKAIELNRYFRNRYRLCNLSHASPDPRPPPTHRWNVCNACVLFPLGTTPEHRSA